ncbi:ABC transporter permease [Loktanella sp. IMCC34160]|uniref:FtsX-like permease family protein n=1 Tax=Loktanella sp. IMCC34160 TaxID=2510646 RepID=UPI00101D061F|nr:ABC transporter permease [Loktanella sp. IMCC34160]RYG91579.1 ABC transporter permease [Loktanella sp. IMCC34160]
MTFAVLSAILSHWRRAPLQFIALLAGLALATALWSGVQAINAEARSSYDAAAQTLLDGQVDRLVPADGGAVTQADHLALRMAGWRVSPVAEGRLNGVRILGLDPNTVPAGVGQIDIADRADADAFRTGDGQIFGRAEALDRLGPVPPEPVPVAEIAPGTVVTQIGVAQRLLDRPAGHIDFLLLDPDQPDGLPRLAEIAPGLSRVAAGGGTDLSRLTDSFHLNLTAFGALSFVVGLFIVHGTVGLAIEQRRPMVRTLRAVGVPLRLLLWGLGLELLIFALAGGALGLILGHLIAGALLPDVASSLRGLYGAAISGELTLRPGWIAAGLAMSLAGVAIAGTGALVKVARLPILAAARPRAWAMGHRKGQRVLTGVGMAALAGAGGLALWGTSLVAGFALVGAVLLGAAAILPAILSSVLRFGESSANGPVAEWFWADSRQQLPGLSLALMALLLAMAANAGVSTMVSSFRLTFIGFLDQRLAAELYVDTKEEPGLEAWLTDRSDAVLPVQSVEVEVRGLPTDLYGTRPDPLYPDNWRLLEGGAAAWQTMFDGRGVLINEQLARRGGIGVGDILPLAGQDLPVVGVFGDYGNPIGQAMIAEPLWTDAYPNEVPRRFAVRTDPAAVPGMIEAMQAEFGIAPDSAIDQAGIKAVSLQVFERTFAVTGALNLLTLGVAGFAILMSLLTLGSMRLPQLAPVWAMGLTRSRLGGLDLLRAVLLAGLTTVLAIPLGLALAWALLAIVNVAAFGWRLPMFLFPADYALLGVEAILAAALAAGWPAIRLSRIPPDRLLRVFAAER